MKDFFKNLFEYSHHFNQKLATEIIENSGKVSERYQGVFSHILNAHQIWNHRIDLKGKPFGVWQNQPLETWLAINEDNYLNSLDILEHFDLEAEINYTNSKGFTFNNKIKDVLFHVINHSTYHRAQIATEFRVQGLQPLTTDYIMYKR